MSGRSITFVLSTGRCGTQWLTAGLRAFRPDARVEHEPILCGYQPRRYFRRYDDPASVLEGPRVRDHLAAVTASSTDYIETGWPVMSALPYLAATVPDRLRVVHLVRHPVPTALSLLSHQSYAGSPRRDEVTAWGTLGPEDPSVFHPEYAAGWDDLSAYERCLYLWGEVNLFGEEFSRVYPDVPFLRVRSESLLAGEPETLGALLDFTDSPRHEGWAQHAQVRVDDHRHRTQDAITPELALRHPHVVTLAERLGYGLDLLDRDALEQRYSAHR